VGDGSSLSATRPRNNSHRPLERRGSLELLRIQRAEDVTSTLSVQFES
jgi:hypothetical protein